MTEAGWTRKAPTKEGWYWWRQEKGMMEVPREVVYSPFYRGLVTQGERLIAGDGEWLGPITPDSYQQGRVAGLVKAVEIIKANTDVKKAIEIIRLHSLAQQAQGGVGDDLFILP